MADRFGRPSSDTTRVTADATTLTADASGSSRTREEYARLVTWVHRGQARFMATVRASVGPFCDVQGVAGSLAQAFDLDTAVGRQLDIDGEIVGAARQVAVPLPNIYFSLDSDTLGVDQGLIQGPHDDDIGLTSLPDEVYRRVLKARALLNRWDGQADSLYDIVRAFLPDPATLISVRDESLAVEAPVYFALDEDGRGLDQGILYRPDFRLDEGGFGLDEGFIVSPTEFGDTPDAVLGPLSIVLANKIPANLDLAVLEAAILPMRPMGQELELLVTSEDRTPMFGLDMDTALIAGLDVGALGASPGTVAALRV